MAYQLKHPLQLTKINTEKLQSLTDAEFKEYQTTHGDRQEVLDRIIARGKGGDYETT